MTTKKRILPALLFSLFAGAAPQAFAQSAAFSNVIVFGDSLSDAGYYRGFLAAAGLPPQLVAIMGRFSTNPGPVWSELVAQHYGVENPAPSNAGGTIYAQGGARVAASPGITPPGQAERPISAQITEYLGANGGAADPRALFTVWGGANDFFIQNAALAAGQITPAQFQANILGVAGTEVQQVGRLFAAGAQHVVVFGGFDASFTPAVAALDPATRAGVTALTAGYNTTLWSGFASNNLRVIPVDLFSFVNEIRANPAAYGFTNVTSPACGPFPPVTTSPNALFCYTGNLVAANANQTYFFADNTGHMTTAANALVAQFVESLIDGPMAYSMLAEAPLASRRIHIRSMVDATTNALRGDVGTWNVFVTADRGDYTVDANGINGGVDARNKGYNIGVAGRVTEAVTIGAAIGHRQIDSSLGGMGGFTNSEKVLSLFGSMRLGGFWGNAVVTIGDIDFNNIQRNIELGPVVRTTSASTGGSNSSAYVSAGYDFSLSRFVIGPMIAVTSQNVEVNGFNEDGGGAANLRIYSQTRHSEVWSAGVRAYLTGHAWLPWVRVTADRERRDDPRVVTAGPLTLTATGNNYDVPAYMPDKNSTTAAVGINGVIAERMGLSLSYYKVFGRSGIKEDGINGVLSYRF